jgi:hypothetical protein
LFGSVVKLSLEGGDVIRHYGQEIRPKGIDQSRLLRYPFAFSSYLGPKVNASDCLGATYINDLLVLDVSVGYLDLWMAV